MKIVPERNFKLISKSLLMKMPILKNSDTQIEET